MRQLLLLRHAKASRDDPKLADQLRPLTAEGRRAAAAIGQAMRELGLEPDMVLVSPAARTLQTLEALGAWDGTPLVETVDRLYDAAAGQLLQVLRGVPETVRSVLLVGHNPGLHDLARLLAGGADGRPSRELSRLAEGYPTATVTEFTIPGPWWTLDAGGGRLMRYLAPRDLPDPER